MHLGSANDISAIVDIAQTSTTEYFRQLISFCDHGWIRAPLLEGFVTSAGAGSESVLQASRTAFVAYSDSCSAVALSMYCTTIIDVVHDNYSNDRLLLPAMEFLGFLFDAGVLNRLANEMFGYMKPTFLMINVATTDVSIAGHDFSKLSREPIPNQPTFTKSKLLSRSMLVWLLYPKSEALP